MGLYASFLAATFIDLLISIYPVVGFMLADSRYFQIVVTEVMSMIVLSIAPILA